MLKDLLRTFLDGAIAGIIFSFVGGTITSYLPQLPPGVSIAVVLGVLVLIIDFVLRRFARL